MWTKLINEPIEFNTQLKILPTKGKLVYEYNPFRNYRLSQLCFEYNQQTYNLGELCKNFGIYPDCYCVLTRDMITDEITDFTIESKKQKDNINDMPELLDWLYSTTRYQDRNKLEESLISSGITDWVGTENNTNPVLREAGELIDFNTNELKISLDHPVQLLPQYSYDGSVNLIINDGINIPRLINSRFSATGTNTYEIIDRKGNNDTNIYDQGDQFDSDTSLVKHFLKIAHVDLFNVTTGGNMKIGNYHFYFRLADADGNETDFICESGQVNLFIGEGQYSSVTTGQKNENCYKQVQFVFKNLDSSYDYMIVYYSRSTSEGDFNSVTEYQKIDKKFIITNWDNYILTITGYEDTVPVTVQDVNPMYYSLGSAKTMTTCQNMLFFGNVGAENIPYNELTDLSLHFLPYLKEENYDCQYDKNYSFQTTNTGYIDPKFIYNKTGYWGEEIYRLGVVYILPSGKLSPVFNIRGSNKITINSGFTEKPLYDSEGNRAYIEYDEQTHLITDGCNLENVKGVVSYAPSKDNNIIYSIDIRISDEALKELKKYVKGYFFVRQERIPLTLAQAITMPVDKHSGLLTIPTQGGILHGIAESMKEGTHIETTTPNGINFISEGFMSRYRFDIVPDHKESWKKALKITGIVVAAIAVVAATVFTCGAAGVALGAGAAAVAAGGGAAAAVGAVAGTSAIAMVAGGAAAVGSTAFLIGAGTVAAAGIATAVGVGLAGSINAWSNQDEVQLNGRNTEIEKGMKKEEAENSRLLNASFEDRFIISDYRYNEIRALLCPEYVLNQPKYNQIFTGDKFVIETAVSQPITGQGGLSRYFQNQSRHFYVDQYQDLNYKLKDTVKIISVAEGVKAVGLDDFIFRSKAGEAEEAFRYEQVGNEQTDLEFKKVNTDIVRGIYCPYLATSKTNLSPVTIVNIKIPKYTEQYDNYFQVRMQDTSPFKAISNRIDINNLDDYSTKSNLEGDTAIVKYSFNVYRGDCYICQFTQRIIRNFNDPSAPYNDDIIDTNSWKNNYDPNNSESYANINLGDVNAVPLGMWVTFKLRSTINLNVRTLDGSNVSEVAMSGHERGYYPYYPMSVDGSYKISESDNYNKGFTKKLSERINVLVPDVPYIKNWFGTRIIYSDVHITDAFKNGFRTFQGTHYRDYTREYGSITKLISLGDSLLVIFEHGIARIPVNERAVAAEGAGGKVYINTSNVLPENPLVITDMYGSQWAESILKVPGRNGTSTQWVYGVDTIAKKIWRTDGNSFECISDGKVQSFLNTNITLGERELTPKIGIRNVKTVYNSFKQDVLFTFYDNTYGFEEKVWNLCWNELTNSFVTFYSWVPSYMENINNIPFSFNRDTSKWIAKLGTSHTENSFADGITLSNNIINNENINKSYVNGEQTISYKSYSDTYKFPVTFINKLGKEITHYYEVDESDRDRLVGVLSLSNRILPDNSMFYQIEYSLERDNYLNFNDFEIVPISVIDNTEGNEPETISYKDKDYTIKCIQLPGGNSLKDTALFAGNKIIIYGLKLKKEVDVASLLSELYYRNDKGHSYADYPSEFKKDDQGEIEKDADGNPIVVEIQRNSINYDSEGKPESFNTYFLNKPIFKDLTGKRINLERDKQLNPDKIVRLLNVKATINIIDPDSEQSLSDAYYNQKAGFAEGTSLINAGYYESTIAVIPKWNLQFLSTDFWKHGQAGIIDIADDIYPTYWYGKQHPFEFECVVVNDPSVHKIFTNLELISNKAKPESFHYEIIGDSYDFAKDKPNMYFRQEAIKALWQYNGADICYNRDFLKVQPKQQRKSADFPHKYYTRQDTINEIEDTYISINTPAGYNYRHLSGAEIVYYPTRQEYRIWQHTPVVDLNELNQDSARSIIESNCQYLEGKWRININPILVCYKNEGYWDNGEFKSNWKDSNRPKLPIMNSPIPNKAYEKIQKADGEVEIPEILTDLGYNVTDMDMTNWLDDNIYGTNFGEAQNRRELDVRDKFMKVRIRYSGEELAVIDFLNTIYRVSYV